MKIVERGHIYEFQGLDSKPDSCPYRITYVNREPGTVHPGIQSQDAIRSLIDRTMHCDQCLRWEGNDQIIYHLRMALILHECRALVRKVEKGGFWPELLATGEDGHLKLTMSMADQNSAILPDKDKIYTMAQTK